VSYTEDAAAISVAAAGIAITDDTNIESATIVLTNASAGDVMSVGTLPGGFSSLITSGAGTITVTLTGSANLALYQTAIQAVMFASTSEIAAARVINVTVNDGSANSNTAVTTISYTGVNDAPIISSDGGAATAAISVAENTTAVTTVVATDPELATPTYSLFGGADQAKFAINATTGALSFIAAPNFEAPTDAGANNTYEVIVRASDGSLSDDQTITVTVTDVNENISISNATVVEGGALSFIVTLGAASANTVTVNYTTATSTAGPFDYFAAVGVVTFAPGVTTQTITVQTMQDTLAEGSEPVIVNLSGAVNGTILDGKGVGTITDNDGPSSSAPQFAQGTGSNSTTANAVYIDFNQFALSNDGEIASANSRPSMTISATGTSGQFDYYRFIVAVNNTQVFLDIDHAQNSAGNLYDPWLNVLDSSLAIIAFDDDASSIDSGSLHTHDPSLSLTLNAGLYYVQVARWANGDTDGTTFNGSHAYELQVSILPPTVTDPIIRHQRRRRPGPDRLDRQWR